MHPWHGCFRAPQISDDRRKFSKTRNDTRKLSIFWMKILKNAQVR
jgi:hypothetical protein